MTSAIDFRHRPGLISHFWRTDLKFVRINPTLRAACNTSSNCARSVPIPAIIFHYDDRGVHVGHAYGCARKPSAHLRSQPVHLCGFINICPCPLRPRQPGYGEQQHPTQQRQPKITCTRRRFWKRLLIRRFGGVKPQAMPPSAAAHPGGGQLAVEPPDITQHQQGMQIINGLTQRQNPASAYTVISPYLRLTGSTRAVFRWPQRRVSEHHAGRFTVNQTRTHGM